MPAGQSGHSQSERWSAGQAAGSRWQSGFHSLWHLETHRQLQWQAAEQLLSAAAADSPWLSGMVCRLDWSSPERQMQLPEASVKALRSGFVSTTIACTVSSAYAPSQHTRCSAPTWCLPMMQLSIMRPSGAHLRHVPADGRNRQKFEQTCCG